MKRKEKKQETMWELNARLDSLKKRGLIHLVLSFVVIPVIFLVYTALTSIGIGKGQLGNDIMILVSTIANAVFIITAFVYWIKYLGTKRRRLKLIRGF